MTRKAIRRKPAPDEPRVVAVIDAPHFYAGIVLRGDVVIEAAPIVDYMAAERWSGDKVRDYCKHKGWHVVVAASIE